jgi:hypothetical protein
MTIRRKMAIPALGALLALGLLLVAQSATATHVRPKAATPLYASMVPSFVPCGAPNRVHAAPLTYGSCNPPVATSPNVTVGTPDAPGNGAPANSVGFIKIVVTNGPGASDADVALTGSVTDVRCSGSTACGAANLAGGPDYVGVLLSTASLNITDHNNATCTTCPGPPTGPFTDTATGTQPSFPIVTPCSTTGTSIGSSCSVSTTANTAAPGAVVEGKRGVVEISQLKTFDGGPTGGSPPGSQFEVQGIFIP